LTPKAAILFSRVSVEIPSVALVFNPSMIYFTPPLLLRKSTSSHLFLYWPDFSTAIVKSANEHPYSFCSGEGLLTKFSCSASLFRSSSPSSP
jgi:hypothetical protein